MNTKTQRGSALRPVLWTLAVIVVIGLVITGYEVFGPQPTDFAAGKRVPLDAYKDGDPSGVPAELKSASLVERGEYLTRAADCAVCHTAKDGVPFAGGRAFVLPFGTMYSTNITPDTETGIGAYTDADFLGAVHKGVGRGNNKLYPAMPYASYTYMSDADALAVKAYLFSLRPVRAPTIPNTFVFPFNQRWLMGFWSAMFNADKRFEPVVDRGAEWNRGAYLVEAMGHCGECHTPRNLFFALNNREKFTGAVQAGWRAYNITPDRHSGLGTWSDDDLSHYLAIGHADGRGTAAGPMGEAIDESLSHLKSADIAAIVNYLRTVRSESSADLPEPKAAPAPGLQADNMDQGDPRGKQVYEGACAGCHGWTGVSPVIPFASLTGTRSINDPTANNVAQVIIAGAQRHYAIDSNNMPAFGATYSDAEIASVANYVTARYGAKGSDLTADKVAKLRSVE
jgi:mono/diheme cytochrome c family protein